MQNHNGSGGVKQNRRKRQTQERLGANMMPGQVVFRLICHVSVIGGVIGSNGTIVSQLRRETRCKIHCEESVAGSDHRVIRIAGSGSIYKRIVLNGGVRDSLSEDEEKVECDVSSAQEALIRVFERLWTVEAENDCGRASKDEVYCGLLTDTTRIGEVVGRRGKNIIRMRRETRAKIRILPPPQCAAKDDELIQITGHTLAVKKALVAVSGCLQESPPLDRGPTSLRRSIEKSHNDPSMDPHAEFFPHLISFSPPMTENSANTASSLHVSSTGVGGDPNVEMKTTEKEVVFRMLCSNGAAGGIIGKRGAIVRGLQHETGASIVFAPQLTQSGERIVTISAFENLESWNSPAQNAVLLVFARGVESDIEKRLSSGLGKDTMVTARLLAASELVVCLTGDRKRVLSEMIEVTGCDIRILGGDQVMDCASENEVVIQINGGYENVPKALFQVTARLRDNLLPIELLNEVRTRNCYEKAWKNMNPAFHQLSSVPLHSNQNDVLIQKLEDGLSESRGASLSPKLQLLKAPGRGHAPSVTYGGQSSKIYRGSSELGRSWDFLLPNEVLNEVGTRNTYAAVRETTSPGLQQSSDRFLDPDEEDNITQGMDQLGISNNIGFPSSPRLPLRRKKTAVVRNTTIEILVAESVFGAVYGKDGSNLDRLRQISGAKVEVHDPCPGENDGMVIISGSPDQTRIAQSLLQAFLQAHQ